MAISLRAKNKDLIEGQKYSYFNSNTSSGVGVSTGIVVVNSDGFTALDFLLFGNFGSETSEIVQIDTGGVDSATHTLTLKVNTKFSHSESTKVTILKYNQVKYYWTTLPTFDSDTLLDTINVQADSLYTVLGDSDHSTGYGWFKFYNSGTTPAKLSAASNAIPYSGFENNTAQKIIQEFLSSLNQKDSKLISLKDAFSWLSEGYSIATTKLNLINKEYKATVSAEQIVTSGKTEYTLPTNCSELLSVWDDTNSKKVNSCSLEDVDKYNSDLYSSSVVYYIKNNNIGFVPDSETSVTYKLTYISKPAAITSLTDTIDLPDNKFYIMKDFLRFRAAEPLGKANGQFYYDLFMKSIEDMKVAAVSRDGELKSFKIDPYCNI